jgi:hypothetical protein
MSDGLKTGIEIAVLALIAAGLVAGTAYVTHRIDAAKLADVQKTQAEQESERYRQTLSDYADAVQKLKGLQASADAAASEAQATIRSQQNETQTLRSCIDAGHGCGLRIRVAAAPAASASGATVPATGPDTVAGYAELASDARPAYFALRNALADAQGRIDACRGYAAQMAK